MTTLEILLGAVAVAGWLIVFPLAGKVLRLKITVFRMEMECKRATQLVKEADTRIRNLQYPPVARDAWPEYIEEKK